MEQIVLVISLSLTVLAVIVGVVKWFLSASADKKLTKEEIIELIDFLEKELKKW